MTSLATIAFKVDFGDKLGFRHKQSFTGFDPEPLMLVTLTCYGAAVFQGG